MFQKVVAAYSKLILAGINKTMSACNWHQSARHVAIFAAIKQPVVTHSQQHVADIRTSNLVGCGEPANHINRERCDSFITASYGHYIKIKR